MRTNGTDKRGRNPVRGADLCGTGPGGRAESGAHELVDPAPKRAAVIGIVRGALANRLDALEQSRGAIEEARDSLELARWVGDEEAAGIIARALDGVAAEANSAT